MCLILMGVKMKNNLMIASPSRERTSSWNQWLNGSVKFSTIIGELDTLWDDVVRIEPEIVLFDLDLPGLKYRSDARLTRLCTKTKVIILSGTISEDMECELLKAGVRGCCPNDVDSELLKQVVMAVQQGELWIRRKITNRLVSELGEISSKHKAYQASHDLLNKLTSREYEIALQVAEGKSNKQIAQSCAITERTVKAHLSEVFYKLGIADRINLALIISTGKLPKRSGESQIRGAAQFV